MFKSPPDIFKDVIVRWIDNDGVKHEALTYMELFCGVHGSERYE